MKKLALSLPLLCGISIVSLAQDATTLYQDGVKLKDQNKVTEAAEKFYKATQLKSNYTEALYELGWCRNDLKDYRGAIEVLRQVAPVWSNIPKVFFELAYAFDKSGSTDSAHFYYNRCLAIKPDYSGAYKQLAYMAYTKGDYPVAMGHFIKYESIIKTPEKDYLYWYRKAYVQNALKDYTAAKATLQKSLEFKTDYLNTYLELGFASFKLKEDEQAIEYYKKGIELDPKSHIAYNGIAEVYRDNKRNMTEAKNWYQKVLAMNPNERKANFGMGYCLNSNALYNDAIPYLKKAIEAENTYTAAYVELGYSYYQTGKTTDAMTNLRQALTLNPKNENARYYMGLIYISQKDKTNAQKMADELKSLNSKNAATLQESVNKM